MFIILSKLLPQFVYPLGLVLLLLVAALVLRKRDRLQNNTIVLALIIIIASGNGWTAMSLVRSLEWRYLPPQETPRGEVIVVLGGSTEPAQFPRPAVEVNGAGDRIIHAARLYHQGSAPYILLSGGRIEWLDAREASSSAEEMAEILSMLGVPEEALWLQSKSRNTYEDAIYSKQVLDEKGIQRIILVTSAMHMPRSVAIFEHQGFEVVPMPVDYGITKATWQQPSKFNLPTIVFNTFPNINNMGMTTGALKEYLGMLVYRLRGWM